MEGWRLEDRAEQDTLLHDANLARELAVLVHAKERAHSKAEQSKLALQSLTNLYPRVGLLAGVPFPQAPIFIETEHDGFGRQLGSSGRYNNGRHALNLVCHSGLLRLARPSLSLRLPR
jgi:hypothetical protein